MKEYCLSKCCNAEIKMRRIAGARKPIPVCEVCYKTSDFYEVSNSKNLKQIDKLIKTIK